jgi:hypothetical protein
MVGSPIKISTYLLSLTIKRERMCEEKTVIEYPIENDGQCVVNLLQCNTQYCAPLLTHEIKTMSKVRPIMQIVRINPTPRSKSHTVHGKMVVSRSSLLSDSPPPQLPYDRLSRPPLAPLGGCSSRHSLRPALASRLAVSLEL